ncbi:hypothetical protein ABG79_00749 [Caloramator mitchellensis]|uniref:Uncharacterized protein n=1 Tax=Caloramator mitchellensis TaxID=908809 RepID=A0A0R3JV26_CALMK|nr:hypothetical protein [Caloramator mitchellensis]KRQ87411.1 hypothetical protein ABG79_00749 [Caloramator mitchellensis]
MKIYTSELGKYKNSIINFRNSKESAKMSLPIEFEGELYRIIEFNDAGFFNKEITGYLILTNEGEVVNDKRIQKEVMTLGYYLELLFDEDSLKRLGKAITLDREIKKEIINYNDSIELLKSFKDEGINGVDIIISILEKLPEIKKQNNLAIMEFVNQASKLAEQNLIMSSKLLNDILPIYRKMLLVNLNRINEINKGRAYFDTLKQITSKKKKSIKNKINGLSPRLTRLEMTLDKLINILKIYDRILNMSESKYIEFLKSQDNQNIQNKLNLIRN